MARKTAGREIFKTIIFCGVIIALLFGLKSLFPHTTKETKSTNTTTTKETVTAKLSTKTTKEDTDTYLIEITNPVVLGLSDTIDKKINDDIVATSASIKKDFLDELADVKPDIGPGEKSTLSVDFNPEEKHLAHNILSLVLSVESYTNGAAHPNHYQKVLHYDVTTGNGVMLLDLFKDKNEAYSAVSKEAIKKLNALFVKEGTPDWFREGAAPTAENYENFILNADTLTIIFNPYQVAAYVRGAVTIDIPLTAFSGKLIF